jgi:hypothetical protein
MEYFTNVYQRRLNRYGLDYHSRLQKKRQADFENYLLKTSNRVDIVYNDWEFPASFERYKQDETETWHYLLTELKTILEPGTILQIPDKRGDKAPWMVYWCEEIHASGYNKYIVIKMTHKIQWKARNGKICETLAYMSGQQNNMLKDELKSRSRMQTLYTENLKLSFLVLPVNKDINKDDYFTIKINGNEEMTEAYKVTGYDRISSKGVEYVSVDPVYIHDESPLPKKQPDDKSTDWIWLDMRGED